VSATPGGSVSVTLDGEGLGSAALRITGTSDHGAVDVATTGPVQTYTVRNDGGSATGALSVQLVGGSPGSFRITQSTCAGNTLAPAATCTIDVVFEPSAAGTVTTSLRVNGSPGGTGVLALRGTGRTYATITVTRSGTGSGTVTSSTPGINCGTDCSERFAALSPTASVTLTATPATGSRFVRWTGDTTCTTASCIVALNRDRNVTAVFDIIQHPLNVTVRRFGGAAGRVTSTPGGIDCAGSCASASANFNYGQSVQLDVSALATGAQVRISGDCTGTTSCTLSMTAPRNVTIGITEKNIAFLTSTRTPGNMGGLSGADAICAARATAAGLPGSYVAWLSTGSVNAISRLAGSRGWIRVDGQAFADTTTALGGSQFFYPLRVDELGAVLPVSDFITSVLTGTMGDGTAQADRCGDWALSGGTAAMGAPNSGATSWTYAVTSNCDFPRPLYCFGVGINRAVSATASGRGAFLSQGSFFPQSGGIAVADTLCQNEAGAQGLPRSTSYRAYLSTNAVPAAMRFSLTGAPWVRLDGVLLAATPDDFVSGALLSALVVTSTRAHVRSEVYTGVNATCSDWTSLSAMGGVADNASMRLAFYESTRTCGNSRRIYCLEN
jgi:hypothetical protein